VVNTSKVATMADSASAGRDARADAFLALADQHLDASYRLAHAILRERAEAEDATQDAFVMAWRKWDSLRDRDLFQRWFDRILINTCRNRLKSMSRRRIGETAAVLPASHADPYREVHERDAFWPALARLTPDQRIVVSLRFYRDLSIDEIAVRVGVRPGTVKSRLHRARFAIYARASVRRSQQGRTGD
jgi:RNA polymerase sigma-70 factor, ECF subfamily